uniref:Ni/Fe hydrogenase subunit alpha n=1 Tax=Thermodesulfovibrio aggregans TaxID=86166 RepID=A0A7C4AJ12_9BACT
MRKIEINPLTRIEGHGRISIFLDKEGDVENAFLQTVEFVGYERILRGVPIEEVPRLVSTICGVCRGVHFIASLKASDEVFSVKPSVAVRKIREIFYNAHIVEDHTAVLYAFGFPDFICGLYSSPSERNLIGVFKKIGTEFGREILKKRAGALRIFEILGGRPSHPVTALPGGWSKPVKEEERKEIIKIADELIELGKLTLKIFEDYILKNKEYEEFFRSDVYRVVLNYLGGVDENDKIAFYDGTYKFIDTKGNEIGRFKGREYLEYIAEKTLPWSYTKAPYLKKLRWKGFIDGEATGLYSVGSLARFNVGKGYNTALAQEAYEKMVDFYGGKPVHNILAYHWARAIELVNAAENIKILSSDESITERNLRQEINKVAGEGIGIVEAPRGTLIHHYRTDEKGIIQDANLIVATTQNKGAINIAVKRVAQNFIKKGRVDERILNMIEIAYRAYDLCFACATHEINNKIPFQIDIYSNEGELIKSFENYA